MALKAVGNWFGSDIPNEDVSVFGTSGDEVRVEVYIDATDSSEVLLVLLDFALFLDIDHPDPSSFLTNEEAFSPFDAADVALE